MRKRIIIIILLLLVSITSFGDDISNLSFSLEKLDISNNVIPIILFSASITIWITGLVYGIILNI